MPIGFLRRRQKKAVRGKHRRLLIERLGARQLMAGDTILGGAVDSNTSVAETSTVAERVEVGNLGKGIATGDVRQGTGYIMYSAEPLFTRFPDANTVRHNAEHLGAVLHQNGEWFYNDNFNNLYLISPQSSDVLVAEVDFTNDTIAALAGVDEIEAGIRKGYASGDLQFEANVWNDQFNNGEFAVTAGTHFIANRPPDILSPIAKDNELSVNHLTADTIVDLSHEVLVANDPAKYPLQVRYTDHDVTIRDATVIGAQSLELTWAEMKSNWDGDGVRMETNGEQTVEGVYIENVEDGFAPRGNPTHWTVKDCWMRYIRDDAIENDTIKSGTVDHCLIDGTYTFLSMRLGNDDPNDYPPANVTIKDSLIWLRPMLDDDPKATHWSTHSDGARLMSGALFKMDPDRTGDTVTMTDCVLRVDQVHGRTADAMTFPAGVYTNVTLVWTGDGEYPAELPPGVTVTKDINIWHEARSGWLQDNASRFAGRPTAEDVAAWQ